MGDFNQAAVGTAASYRRGPPAQGELVDAWMISLLRCLCAFSAIIIFQFERTNAHPDVAYFALIAYSLFCVGSCVAAYWGRPFVPIRAEPWIDVFFYTFLIVLTGGPSSIFYHYYFFAILVAAFTRGHREGLAITACAVVMHTLVGFAATPSWLRFELNHALIRTLYLFLLGYVISQWGGHEIAQRGRLHFLRRLSELARPRMRAEHVVHANLRALASFFEAQACILVVERDDGRPPMLYRANRRGDDFDAHTAEIGESMAPALLGVPATTSASVRTMHWWPDRDRRRVKVFTFSGKRVTCDRSVADKWLALATLLETPHMAGVPYIQPNGMTGRLYLCSDRPVSDAQTEFLSQAVCQMAAAVNNVMLQEELARRVTEQERASISRDIHDTSVQSHIALKLGLEALYRSLEPKAPLAIRIKELLDVAAVTADDLRGYVNRLQGRKTEKRNTHLAARLDEQVRRYRQLQGLEVQLRCADLPPLDEKLSNDAHGLVSEALSNVFRHTTATSASVEVRCEGGTLAIEVANDSAGTAHGTPVFIPGSITDRAANLGGTVQVRLNSEGRDVVKVTLPLPATGWPAGAQAHEHG